MCFFSIDWAEVRCILKGNQRLCSLASHRKLCYVWVWLVSLTLAFTCVSHAFLCKACFVFFCCFLNYTLSYPFKTPTTLCFSACSFYAGSCTILCNVAFHAFNTPVTFILFFVFTASFACSFIYSCNTVSLFYLSFSIVTSLILLCGDWWWLLGGKGGTEDGDLDTQTS